MRGVARHHGGDYAGAVADQKACLQYHPHFVNALNNLGRSLSALGRYDEAIAPLQEIRTLQPNHVESYVNLAAAYRGKASYDRAIDAYRSAIQLDTKRPLDIRLELASTLEIAERYDEALEELSGILARDSTRVSAHYRTAAVRQRQGKWTEALEALDAVFALTDEYVPAYYTRGEVLVALGDTTGAIAAYEGFLNRWKGAPGAAQAVRKQIEALR